MDMHNNELLEACKTDKELLDELLRENSKYIHAIIHKYKGGPEELKRKFNVEEEEVLQHAYLGVLSALRDFDSSQSKFTTYVVRPILWEINQFLYCDSRLIRLSRSAVDILKRAKELEDVLGYAPSEDELAEALKIPPDRLTEVVRFTRELEHFDSGEQMQVKDTSQDDAEEHVLNKLIVTQILQSRVLSDRDKQVVRLIMSGKNNSQIAEILGVYPMTVTRDIARVRKLVLNEIEENRKVSKYDSEIELIAEEIIERGQLMPIDDISELLDVCGYDISKYSSRTLYYIRQKAQAQALSIE
jgi:RNA polymerase primary sigma factor/RNA polymerase sporulation-specific sigma factor